MKKALVTGAAGFIGSHIAEWLCQHDVGVVALDDLSGGVRENVPSDATWVRGSVVDHEMLAKLFETERFDYVYHFAAHAAEALSHFVRRHNYITNLVGTVNLINLSVNYDIECFVFPSSIGVYGEGRVPMTEEDAPRPADPYGIAKYAIELDLEVAKRKFGLNYIIFRPHNVYGERQNISDKYRNVVGAFMNQILSGQPLTIFDDGTQVRAFSYIDDVAPVIAGSVWKHEAYGDVFNIGGDQLCTINELAEIVSDAMGATPLIVHLRSRKYPMYAYSSHEKLRRIFDVPEPTPLREGIAKMAKWVRGMGTRKTKSFAAIEISRGLPQGW